MQDKYIIHRERETCAHLLIYSANEKSFKRSVCIKSGTSFVQMGEYNQWVNGAFNILELFWCL